jgi:DNA-binding transcriptional MerR regulator
MQIGEWKVGDVAKRTGVSVRTLHHYHEIGLLTPSFHAPGSHRLYSAADVTRLQQIQSLRQLGFSLGQIRECLDSPGFSPLEVIERHLAHLAEQVEQGQALCRRLEALAAQLRSGEEATVDEFLETIGEISAMEKYYTKEQLKHLEQRRQIVGEDRIKAVEAEWNELFASYREARERGLDPASDEVRALAQKSRDLIAEFTGGDAGIHGSLSNMWANDPSVKERYGVESKLSEYIGRAAAALEDSD